MRPAATPWPAKITGSSVDLAAFNGSYGVP
jgi:hypothetical protein